MSDMKALPQTAIPTQNQLGQPIGFALPGWNSPSRPPRTSLHGQFCRLEPLDPARHAAELYSANALDADQRMWTYLAYGPFLTLESYAEWMHGVWQASDPIFYAIVDLKTNRPVGVASYLRIDPPNGSIEVGHLAFSPLLQRTPAATESMFLMMQHAFDLGYRRYEWKCDALNLPSRNAAQRLGFLFEGLFRQAVVYKHRNRDTAWYSIIDREWPQLQTAFLQWLAPENFNASGEQKSRLSELTAAARA
ncbi:MAG: N-acetyltransferase [Planctomycetaceae bacterium]|nr:N-acetyltransferase [Planctomycetaceae bacterium]